MKPSFTRFTAILLALLLFTAIVPSQAFADENASIVGAWETDITFPAADLGVQASDSIFRCHLTFHSDSTVTATWTAIDLTAIRLYFHQMFVSAYYAMGYGAGITDLNAIETYCMASTGMTVSQYMDTIVTPAAIEAALTPADESGIYRLVGTNLYLEMTLMGVYSDHQIANPIVLNGNSLQITPTAFGKADTILNFTKTSTSSDDSLREDEAYVDITAKLNVLMIRNAEILEDYLEEHGYVNAALFYHNMVTDAGDWDIKRTPMWQFESGKTYIYQGKVMRMDDPGNIHFGYLGAILFPEEFVCFGAGMNNLLKFGFDQGDLESYYDDPQDQEMMRWGYRMYKTQELTK